MQKYRRSHIFANFRMRFLTLINHISATVSNNNNNNNNKAFVKRHLSMKNIFQGAVTQKHK